MTGNRRLAIGTGGAVVLLASLDAYVIVTVFTEIMKDLALPVNRPERITPVITGFLLGYVAAMPLLGQLSDRFGRRGVLHLCLAAFAVGSVVTALSTEVFPLVAGRVVQGIAGGALLPITMALAGDLWEERKRPVVLGVVGAAQEMGSVLGPIYGAVIAGLIGWQGIFWINVPLALAAMAAIHFTVPGTRPENPGKVDAVGGLLLALALGLLVIGSYNPEPEESALPPWGPPTLLAGLLVIVAFAWWERRSPAKLLDLTGVSKAPVFAVLGVSLLSGTALMVTLVNVQLIATALLERTSQEGAFLLSRFLIALALSAIVGGFVAHRYGERLPLIIGMAVAGLGFVQISNWALDPTVASYGPLPRMDADLVIAGIGLGTVIAPVSSAILRLVPSTQHGVGSAGVVVARMMGMLVGMAAVSAYGFHRLQTLVADLKLPLDFKSKTYLADVAAFKQGVKQALHTEYREIFLITAVLCFLGAILAGLVRERPNSDTSLQKETQRVRA